MPKRKATESPHVETSSDNVSLDNVSIDARTSSSSQSSSQTSQVVQKIPIGRGNAIASRNNLQRGGQRPPPRESRVTQAEIHSMMRDANCFSQQRDANASTRESIFKAPEVDEPWKHLAAAIDNFRLEIISISTRMWVLPQYDEIELIARVSRSSVPFGSST